MTLNFYSEMLKIRLFEERVRDLRLKEDIVGSVHLCIGQEVIPVAVSAALDHEVDQVCATYRGHGWAIAKGVPLRALFAELLGRATGTNGGRAGSAYLSSPEHGFLGENSIVGAGAPIACGAALAARYDGSGRVVVTSFGDGAMNQGALLESINFAAAMKLPVVFVCENNEWSELTPFADMVSEQRMTKRANGFGMAAIRVDGNDPAATHAAAERAIAHARAGEGPTLIEAMTQRLVGHYIGDPEVYRSDEDRARLLEQDPLPRLRAVLVDSAVTETELSAAEREVQQDIDLALRLALTDPVANPDTVMEHVHA